LFAAVAEYVYFVAPFYEFFAQEEGVPFKPSLCGQKIFADQPDFHPSISIASKAVF
jgi:hypothetical protein